MREITGLDQAEAADQILGLGVRAVGDDFLVALDHHAGAFQRMTELLEMAVRAKLPEPRGPFLQLFLPLLGGCGSIPAAAIQIGKFPHCLSSLVRNVEQPYDVRDPQQQTFLKTGWVSK
jgi:hypothetical protein